MRILYILKSFEKGGAERYVIDLCLELNNRKNIEYKLLILQEGNDFYEPTSHIAFIQMPKPFIPSILRKSEFDNSQYVEILNDFKPDVIHSHLFRSELYTATHVLQNVKYVVHGHDNMKEFRNFDLRTFFSKKLITNFFEKRILLKKYIKNKDTYFIANSNDTLNYYQRVLPHYLISKIKIIEYGFNFKKFYFKERPNKAFEEKIKIVNVGRFAIYKNQKLLIQIALILKQKGILFEMNLLGVGDQFENIKELIRVNNLKENVKLLGNIDNVEDWLNNSDFYIHSAYYEPFGLVLLEAMASGLPCIILNGKGNADVIQNGFNGFITDNEDPDFFVDKLIELYNNKIMYFEISKNAQTFASEFSIEKKTDELISFYKEILS